MLSPSIKIFVVRLVSVTKPLFVTGQMSVVHSLEFTLVYYLVFSLEIISTNSKEHN